MVPLVLSCFVRRIDSAQTVTPSSSFLCHVTVLEEAILHPQSVEWPCKMVFASPAI